MRALVRELKVEVGLTRRQVAVPQTHPAGEEAEVDFGEFTAVIAGITLRLWMFVLRLSHSGKAVHLAWPTPTRNRSPSWTGTSRRSSGWVACRRG